MPSTWEGAAPWDPGGRLPREQTLDSKGPIEAMDIAPGIDAPQHNDTAGIDAHKKTQKNLAAQRVSQRRHYQHQKQSCTCTHPPSSHPTIEGSIRFSFRGPLRGRCVVLEDVETQTETRHCNVAVWWPSHLRHMQSHMSPRHARSGALAERNSTCGHNRSIQSLHAPVFIWRHFAAVPRLSAK